MNKLGFGFLRLPKKENVIDELLLNEMVDKYISLGHNYFDTAYTYLNGLSEQAIKTSVVDRYSRDQIRIANKLPGYKVTSEEENWMYFNEQLERCGVDYFDVYMLHWLNRDNYEIAKKYHQFEFLQTLKEQQKAFRIGFSYHDSADLLDEILTTYPFIDVVQLQINYLDWESEAIQSRRCYEVARSHGKSIIVMEPVKGGTLANLPMEASTYLSNYASRSSAAWALNFAQSLEGVEMVLSGMNTLAQMEENLQEIDPLTEPEIQALKNVCHILNEKTAVACTTCHYCVSHCPMHIAIPQYFALLNELERYPADDWKIEPVYNELIKTHGAASSCIECRQCERNCPQQLKITDYLKEVAKKLEH